ncbi:MAG: O-antigen ligase family protein [Candidatus Fibromonas sp.]|jgi:O-antigen ligase|nr:O-antigen ligase family protein [Candidatus Fibromonas sp.]
MFLIPFVSFAVCYSLGQPMGPTGITALQSSIIAAILFITFIIFAFKNKLTFSIEMLPYLAMPVILFISINKKLEFASYDMLLCFSMFVSTLIVFSQKEIYSKWVFRSMIICGNLHLLMQIFGIIINNRGITIRSLFPMANEIMFFYMLVMFSSILVFCKDNAFWKRYATAIGILVFLSLVIGETIETGKFEVTTEHAVGIWLGLGCGILFTLDLFVWKNLNLPKKLGLSITALIFLAWMLTPIAVINYNFLSFNRSEATTRLDNWQAAWNLIREEPLGVGFGAYGANIMHHWPTIEENYHKTGYGAVVFTAAHNQYLQILTETGWPGWLYYCALFAVPWFVSVFRYLKTGKTHFLFIAGMLASMLSVMELSEAISMFAFIQIIHWIFLLYCVRALLPLRAKPRNFTITGVAHNLFFIALISLFSYLSYDRGKQLYSIHLTDLFTRERFLDPVSLNNALEVHPKNSGALWWLWQFQLHQRKFEDALKTLEKIEHISGTLWSVDQVRAEIYYEMGNMEKACEAAKFPMARFNDAWTVSFKEKLNCGN